MGEPPERTSPPAPLPVRLIGKAPTRVVARGPWTWPLMRRPVRGFFDRLAGGWDERVRPDSPEHLAALAAAVPRLEAPPPGPSISAADRRRSAVACPKLPEARVTGLDISEAMIDQARAKLPADPSERVEFSVGGAERLPFADGSFETGGPDQRARVLR